jgi:hypothetical protein
MGTGYVRNDTANNIADGNVINASDLDGEFDAVQSAFNASSGHSHDGTTGEGPPIDTAGLADDSVTPAKLDSTLNYTVNGLVATNITFGGVQITSTAAELNILDGVTSTATEINKLDGFTGTVDDLNYAKDLRATGVTTTEFDKLDGLTATATELNYNDITTLGTVQASKTVTADGSGNINFNSGNMTNVDIDSGTIDATTVGAGTPSTGAFTTLSASSTFTLGGVAITATGAELNYTDGVTSNIQTQLDAKGTGTVSSLSDLSITATAAELNKLDNVTTSTAELNILDGDTSATSTTLADADRVVVNDNGTMVQVAMTDVKTYTNSGVLLSSAIGSTVQAYDADTAKTDVAQTFSKAQRGSTLTDTTNTGNVTLDFATYQNFVLTLTGNVTLVNPTTEAVGQSGFIVLIQDGTGSRTLSLGTDYETAAGGGITLSTTASTTDIVPYIVAASGRILLGAPQLAFA